MENWGLVTYREVDLLIDPIKASPQQRERVCTVVAHELAHQWVRWVVVGGVMVMLAVRQPGHDGLVERSLAERRIRHLHAGVCKLSIFPHTISHIPTESCSG